MTKHSFNKKHNDSDLMYDGGAGENVHTL